MEESRIKKVKLASLDKANAVRARQRDLREALKAKRIDPIKLCRGQYSDWETVIVNWRLEMLLRAIPGVGPVVAQDVYERGRFNPTQLIRSLSDRRRDELARLVKEGRRISGNVPRSERE